MEPYLIYAGSLAAALVLVEWTGARGRRDRRAELERLLALLERSHSEALTALQNAKVGLPYTSPTLDQGPELAAYWVDEQGKKHEEGEIKWDERDTLKGEPVSRAVVEPLG